MVYRCRDRITLKILSSELLTLKCKSNGNSGFILTRKVTCFIQSEYHVMFPSMGNQLFLIHKNFLKL